MPVKNREIRLVKSTDREDTADLKKTTTPEQRWAMMWQLALDAWAFKGEPVQNREDIDILSASSERKSE
jgi:hypothetical protein